MNCIIPGPNLKVFAKALQALAKIGDDLYIEATKKQFSLITLNLRKTICVRHHLLEIFFSTYEIDENQIDDKTEAVFCKIHLKTILPLFKGSHLEKKLDFIKLEYENNSDHILLKMKYKCDDILMTHQLLLMETETLTIDISPAFGSNNITTTSTFYNQLLNMFSNSDDEIIFEITKDKAIMRNYCVGAPVRPKSVRSQVSPNGSEFTVFSINQETVINFSLKPFRTAIQFAEFFNLNIHLHFEKGGQPLVIVMKNPTFEMNFVIATVNPYNDVQSTVTTPLNNLTRDDQEALLHENWEDFSLETSNKVPVKKTNNSRKKTSVQETMKNSKNGIYSKENNNKKYRFVEEAPIDDDQHIEQQFSESPVRKKSKVVFGKCFESTFSKDNLGEILAFNSDSD